jgi:hypothetical protein
MRRLLVIAVVAALACSACGGDDDGTDAGGASTTIAEPGALGPGVTADTIKVAVSLVDFACIEAFVDDVRIDQDKVYDAYFDDLNANGGINGRTVEPVYKVYCPIPGAEPSSLSVCTAATEDDDVFAIMGVFVDFTGDAQLCVTRDHERVLITHGLSQAWIDEAPPGLLLTPDITAERRLDVILSLLDSEGMLEGRKVAVLAAQDNEGRIASTVDPALDAAGVDRGSDGVLAITGTDTAAAQAQLDSFIEKWKDEDVDTIVILGETTSAKQFVEKIDAEMPDAQLVADVSTILGQGRDLVRAGTEPNPYDGMITAEGETGEEHSAGEEAARCRAIYKAAFGEDPPGPNEVVTAPNGKRNDIYGAVSDACTEVTMLADIAKQAGDTLNAETWTAAVHGMGEMRIASTKYASLGEGKYDADDTYRLVAFDPEIPEHGDWKGLTPARNVADLG